MYRVTGIVLVTDMRSNRCIYHFPLNRELQIPAWSHNDQRMEEIFLDTEARVKSLVEFRKKMHDSPEFAKTMERFDWKLDVRISSVKRS